MSEKKVQKFHIGIYDTSLPRSGYKYYWVVENNILFASSDQKQYLDSSMEFWH